MERNDILEASDIPPLGRREFFGLLAWRAVQVAAGTVLISELSARNALANHADGSACTPEAPFSCTAVPSNVCNEGTAPNECTATASGQANICTAPNRNTCTASGVTPRNLCSGRGGGGENTCTGAEKTNCCVAGAGSNTCSLPRDGGVTNSCAPPEANYCDPPGANSCGGINGAANGTAGVADP